MAARKTPRLLVAFTAVVVAGCGADTPTAVAPATSTSTDAPTTTTAPPPRADAATTDLAMKATITPADLGDAWTLHADGHESEPVPADDCAAGSPIADLPAGARHVGPQVKTRDARWFVYSNSAVFPDEGTAVKWVEFRKSPTFLECRRVELEKGQQATDSRFSVSLERTTTDGLGQNGFESYALYQLKADVGSGPQNSNATFARHTYRVGRTVITLSIDIAAETTDPADLDTRVSNDVTRALTTAYQRIGQS
ncbi:MAG: hypothetical protein HOY78_24930 [Saccharothrix sp.]|nr:hypothetical protein [Saccharothrix sp.]